MRRFILAAVVLFLATSLSCGGDSADFNEEDPDGGSDSDSDGDADNDSDSDSDIDSDSDSDADSDGDSDSDSDGDSDGDSDSDSDSDTDGDSDSDSESDTDTGSDSDSESDTDTGSDSDTGPSVDCDALPPLPIGAYETLNIPGSEDFTFDDQGNLWGVTVAMGSGTGGNNLVKTLYSGQSETVMPNVGTPSSGGRWPMTVRGMRFLPGGDLVFADRGSNSVMRLNMTNLSKQPIASGFSEPNGIALDRDGMIYLTGANKKVVRIHPDTGATETMFTGQYTLDGIAFSPDYKILYFNTEQGHIAKMLINDDGSAGTVTRLATIQGTGPGGGGLDGLTTDECGNVYVVQMSGTIWRISPEGGEPKKVVTVQGGGMQGPVLNAMNFGNGTGGWKADSLYLINMGQSKVYEVEVGVRGIVQP
ncbi:MAG: hypothetical protein GY847_40920 [Proteobacteria bacterium]|nr:hypothetical protein [Pseudomonadota bacterium]